MGCGVLLCMLFGLSQLLQRDRGLEPPQNLQPGPGGEPQGLPPPPDKGAGTQLKVTNSALFDVLQETNMVLCC